MSRNNHNFNLNSNSIASKVVKGFTTEENDFDPSKINVFLDIAEYDIIPKLTKYINLNGGVSYSSLNSLV